MVEMVLWIDGKKRGEPIVVTEPGQRASVEVGDADGQNGWRVELLVEPTASEGDPGGAIWVNLEVYRRSDGTISLLADSLLGVPEGRPGVLSVVDAGQSGEASPENSRVYLTARTSLLRPASAQD